MKPTFITLFIVSVILNIGQYTGYIRLGAPEIGYNETQRAMMQALVEDVE